MGHGGQNEHGGRAVLNLVKSLVEDVHVEKKQQACPLPDNESTSPSFWSGSKGIIVVVKSAMDVSTSINRRPGSVDSDGLGDGVGPRRGLPELYLLIGAGWCLMHRRYLFVWLMRIWQRQRQRLQGCRCLESKQNKCGAWGDLYTAATVRQEGLL
jgi:hypothetical protein